jgi:hypothetical protein
LSRAALPARARYYRGCILALGRALDIEATALGRLVASVTPGTAYDELPNLPYRSGGRLVDARDRKAAAGQLIALRRDILRGARPLKFDHQTATARMMQQGGEGLRRIAQMAAHGDG